MGSSASQVGFVQVRDTWDRSWDADGNPKDLHIGRLQAGFTDLSTVTSTPAQVMSLSEVCFGLISRPVRTGQAAPISVQEVRVEGTARGTILASPAGVGTYVAVGEPLLGAGEQPLRFVVTSTAADPGFALDEVLDSLRSTVSLTAPDPAAPLALTTGLYPLRWSAAGADWVEISIAPEGDGINDGGQVVCRVADTGCFDLPASATAFLLSANALSYTLSVQLQRYQALETDSAHFVELEILAETRLTLENGVFQ